MTHGSALPIETALFDIDGTLADTDPVHAKCWQMALREVTGLGFDVADYIRQCLQGGMNPAEFILSMHPGVRQAISIVAERKADLYREVLTEVELNPGVLELLKALEGAGIPIGIVSSGSANSVESFLDSCWPVSAPSITISRESVRVGKPSPDPYAHAIVKMKADPRRAVAFEDSLLGEQSALAAGASVVSTRPVSFEGSGRVRRVITLAECRVEGSGGSNVIRFGG